MVGGGAPEYARPASRGHRDVATSSAFCRASALVIGRAQPRIVSDDTPRRSRVKRTCLAPCEKSSSEVIGREKRFEAERQSYTAPVSRDKRRGVSA
jgi:hypothetical protein